MTTRWRAPGRVNLIGEHTDYNQGLALPFAIEQGSTATVGLRESGFHATTTHDDQRIELASIGGLPDLEVPLWVKYVLGPAWVLHRRGIDVPALRVGIDSSVPVGAGLSSSAAVICSVTTALLDLLELRLDADELLAVTRAVENDVVGAPTGGLDQLTSLRGQAGHALLCDFADLSSRPVPFDPGVHGLALLVVDTQAPHAHATGEYGRRRAGCEAAARALGLASLREVGDLDAALASLREDEQRRYVRHVVTENDRVRRVAALLESGDVGAIGPLLTASHDSLRDDYRVTVPPLDIAVATLLEHDALGARMTGGGFGGCVIGLLPVAAVAGALAAVRDAFADHGFDPPSAFVTRPSGGARRI
ncbi:MAG: galactokinase [Nocardioidaceae bacterium]